MLLGLKANIFLCATSAVSASLRANPSGGFSASPRAVGINGAMRRDERTQSHRDRRGSAEDYLKTGGEITERTMLIKTGHECIQVGILLGRKANIFLCATSAVSASLRANYHYVSRRDRGLQGLSARCAGLNARRAAEIAEAAQSIILGQDIDSRIIYLHGMTLGLKANIFLCATSAVSASLRANPSGGFSASSQVTGIGGAMRRDGRTQSHRDRGGSAEDNLRHQHECIQVRVLLGLKANIFLCATSAVSASLRVNPSRGFSVSPRATGTGGARRRV